MDYSKYQHIIPRSGYLLIKEAKDTTETRGLIRSGFQESYNYAYVICNADQNSPELKQGTLVVYDEMEGQELYKWDKAGVNEDGLIIIKADKIIAYVHENI